MAVFIKKPIAVEAVQFNGVGWVDDVREPMFDLSFDAPEWLLSAQCLPMDHVGAVFIDDDDTRLTVRTLEGPVTATPGDWIIQGVQGELYPCKPDIFEQTYEATQWPIPMTAPN